MALQAEADSSLRYGLRIPGILPLSSLDAGMRASREGFFPAMPDHAGPGRPPALAPVTKDSGDSTASPVPYRYGQS